MKGSARLAIAVGLAAAGTAGAGPAARAPAAAASGADPAMSLAALDRNLADLDSTEQLDRTELAGLGGRVALAHARVVAHGRAYYKMTRAGLLPVGGGFAALVTHAMHVERARRLVTADLRAEVQMHARAQDLEREVERVERDRAALSGQRQTLLAARAAMEDELRRQAAFDRAFQTSTGAGADYVAVYGGPGALASDAPVGGFAAARGRLLFPVVARADVRAVHREGAQGPGLEIRAPAGALVRAVFAARVAFADRYGAYGRIVILDHGDHYYTVSGSLDSIDVKIGQEVAAGDRIGTVGDEGAGPMLYFEVRHGSQTLAAGPFLGL
jgi:murein DD-endopeptidase MepM/ murein hydrolase activator NlpD